ncbi:mitogen-activated protein kinase kinase kinase 3-like [Phalaenopsis equestris]|uniref:mitogen-activated protein kinase kinase kinase 3-like n=1 Tax=Phalaenopsis equestris TaxID=78828 RepID=UPI0009E18D7B|nr:mitogen-activated protein kinase kinase kinase 3-like [Phalaenopsis equestris]
MRYVHCDIKPDNILIVDGKAKIADFGLTTREGEESTNGYIRGTPLYVAPESASRYEYNATADIWALRCSVSEMASDQLPWLNVEDFDYGIWPLLFRIGCNDELSQIPQRCRRRVKIFVVVASRKIQTNSVWLLIGQFSNSTYSSENFETTGFIFDFRCGERDDERIGHTKKLSDWANTLSEKEEEEEGGWFTVREKNSSGRIQEEIVQPEESLSYA